MFSCRVSLEDARKLDLLAADERNHAKRAKRERLRPRHRERSEGERDEVPCRRGKDEKAPTLVRRALVRPKDRSPRVEREAERIERKREAHASRFDVRLLQRPDLIEARALAFGSNGCEGLDLRSREELLCDVQGGATSRVVLDIDADDAVSTRREHDRVSRVGE